MFIIKSGPKKLRRIFAAKVVKELHKRHKHAPKDAGQLEVNLVTSWNKQCGIATYSAFLAEELRKKVKLFVTSLAEKNALNPYFIILGYRVGHSNDLVHVQFEYGLFPSLKLGKKTLTAFAALLFYSGLAFGNRKVITTIHEPRKTISASRTSALFYTKLIDGLIFAVSDLIVVHMIESKALMKTAYGIGESRLLVIPHGSFESPVFQDKDACKLQLGMKNKTVLTILGFVTPKKGHDLVVPLLPLMDANVQLVVAGGPQNSEDVAYVEKLKKQAEQYHVADRVTFTGYLQDLTCVLNATDIALLPYRNVTDSGILHLWIAQRVPTIASDLKAFKEVYNENHCLELFESENPQDLLKKIRVLLSDPKQRDLLAEECRQMWNKTRWSSIAEKHVDAYNTVLSTVSD